MAKDTEEASAKAAAAGRAPRRQYRFSIHDIAKAKGKSVEAVRGDRQRSKFNPHDLVSLADYIIGDGLGLGLGATAVR